MSKTLFLTLLIWLLSSKSWAEEYFDGIQIELITISAGKNYWEAFGHSALRVKSATFDVMYGFGYFNFNDKDFFLNFARGDMRYFMGVVPTDVELDEYQDQGRKITQQVLVLSAKQKHELLKTLEWLQKEENRYYHYDYFLNNCTTKIRDILDSVTQQTISQHFKNNKTSQSWSDLTFPTANQAWMNLGIAIAYGMPAYQKRSQWQLSVFPETFARDLSNIHSNAIKVLPMHTLYQPNRQEKAKMQVTFFATHYAVIVCVLVFLWLFFIKISRNVAIKLWLITETLLGIGLLLLMFFTQHSVATLNFNILLFNPLGFLLLFKRFNSPLALVIFFVLNLLWLVYALFVSNLYLFGFFTLNLTCLYFKICNCSHYRHCREGGNLINNNYNIW